MCLLTHIVPPSYETSRTSLPPLATPRRAFLLIDVHTQGEAWATLAKLAAAALTVEVAGHTLSPRYGLRLQSASASEPSRQLLRAGGGRTTEGRALGITLAIIAAVMLVACCLPFVQLLLGKYHSNLHTRLAIIDDDDLHSP